MEIKGNYLIGAKEAKAINDTLGILSEGKRIRVLIVAEEITQFDGGAREFSASEEGTMYSIAEAFAVKNLAQKIIANFYVRVNKPKIPSKTFNSEEEAMEWLLSLKSPE